MNTGLDAGFISETYQKMDDQELVRVATTDAAGLTIEAQEIVKNEIRKRHLDLNILNGIDAQQKEYTIETIDTYCRLIQQLPCPISGSDTDLLNGTNTSVVMSFIFLTTRKRKIIIACPEELDKANNRASLMTALLGWWSLPWGPIRSIQAIIQNERSKRTNRIDTPNDSLRTFVLANIGRIETYKEDKAKLESIIKRM